MVEVEKKNQQIPEQTKQANRIIAKSLGVGTLGLAASEIANFGNSGNAIQTAALASFFWLISDLAVYKSKNHLTQIKDRTKSIRNILSSKY